MKNMLESHGIASIVKNEAMQGIGIGELGMCWPELWLENASQQLEAEILVKEAISNIVAPENDWCCKNCSESNEVTFHICWNCCEAKL